jgi:hypothetical protein
MRIVIDERTRRQGLIIATTKRLYVAVGQAEALRVANTLNAHLDLPDSEWKALVARLVT